MKRTAATIWLLMLTVAGTPTLVLAEEHAGGGEGVSPFAGNLGNAIWTLLIFMVVVAVLGKFAWGPILSGLQKREEFIRESLASAKRNLEAAQAHRAEYEQKLHKARQDASMLVDEGRRDAEAVKRRIEEDARRSADEAIERAKREIGIARDSALRDLYERSADLAMTMAGSVLRRQVSVEDHRRLVEEALAELSERQGSRN